MKLPAIARHGQSLLERKLLSYMAWRKDYPFEVRYKDSTLYGPEDLPELLGLFEFVPLFEVSERVFMFQYKQDRDKAVKHLSTLGDKHVRQKTKRRNRRPNQKRRR